MNTVLQSRVDQLGLLNASLLEKNKNTEALLKETSDKLKHMVAEKNTFLAMSSHDLKSPLNSILGLLNLFNTGSDNLTADQKENIAFIFTAGKKMKTIIDTHLEQSKIEQGKSLVQKKGIDLIPVVQEIIVGMSTPAEKKNIRIAMAKSPDQVPIFSDASIISQIVENLISNAIKFSPHGKQVEILVSSPGDYACIDIKDHGPGIMPEEAHKLFGRFQKLSAKPTGGESSTGLGLSIVKELVATLDGKVSFKSEPGVSTVFSVQLPVR